MKRRGGGTTICPHGLLRRVSKLSDEDRRQAYVGRIARGAGITAFGQLTGRTLNYATQVALARMFGPAQLGLYTLGLMLVQLASVAARVGMNHGVVRYVAAYRADGDVSRVRGTILLALWTSFALSLGLAGAMFFGAGFVANDVFGEPFLEAVIRAFSVCLPLLTTMGIALHATQGFQTMKYETYVQNVQHPLLNLVLIVVFYLLGVQVLGAVLAYVLSTAAGAVLALHYLRRVFPKLLDRGTPPKFEPRALFGLSAPMIVVDFSFNVNHWIGTAVLGVFATASAVGIFNAALRVAALSSLALVAFIGIFSPMISDLYSRGELEDLKSLYREVSRWIFTGSLAVFLVTVLLAKDVMAIFGPEFVSGWAVLVVVAAAQLFASSAGTAGRVLSMTGNQKVVAFSMLGSTIVSVIVMVALVPLYGMLGAGVGTAAALVSANGVGLIAVRRLLGFSPYDRDHLKPLAAGAIGAAAILLCKPALPAGVVSVLVLGPLFVLVFAGSLLALGLTPGDRQFLATLRAAFSQALLRRRGA